MRHIWTLTETFLRSNSSLWLLMDSAWRVPRSPWIFRDTLCSVCVRVRLGTVERYCIVKTPAPSRSPSLISNGGDFESSLGNTFRDVSSSCSGIKIITCKTSLFIFFSLPVQCSWSEIFLLADEDTLYVPI